MNIPLGLHYTRDHEWAKAEGVSLRVGITDYAQHELGDIVFVDLKPAGAAVKKGESIGTLESVKAVSDAYAPVTGTISEVNPELETNPELVNTDCYGKGWLVLITPAEDPGLEGLMDAKAYQEYIAKEAR